MFCYFLLNGAFLIIIVMNRDETLSKLINNGIIDENASTVKLIGKDFSNIMYLVGADFSYLSLVESTLTNINLSNANFRGADLTNANLSNANLRGANFTRANLEGADFSNALLHGVSFTEANTYATEFSPKWKRIINLLVSGVIKEDNLNNYDFSDIRVIQASLSDKNLDNAIFTNSIILDSDFNNSSLKKPIFTNADLSGTSFSFSDLTNAMLGKCILKNVNFYNANLNNATLAGADIAGAVFEKANFCNTDVRGMRVEPYQMESLSKKKGLINFDKIIVRQDTQTKRCILMVDDDAHILKLYRMELEEEGYRIYTAISGKDGIEKFESINPDLVILDILIPDIDGLTLLRMMKEQRPRTPIIMNTAYDYRNDFAVWASEAYMVKCTDLTEIKGIINKLITSSGRTDL